MSPAASLGSTCPLCHGWDFRHLGCQDLGLGVALQRAFEIALVVEAVAVAHLLGGAAVQSMRGPGGGKRRQERSEAGDDDPHDDAPSTTTW